ncbi:hypothetical protein ES708_24540 [subsurface metagenome]
MKKLLIMLMVVAMASFLFVGCLPVTPPIDPEDPDEPVGPPSTTPVIEEIRDIDDEVDIINLYSSATQYMNAKDVADGILVKGFAPKYSEINVYVGGVVVGTGYAYGVGEGFTVFVAKADLGVDGAKTLYATATEIGLDESVPSTTYAFTLDTVAPEIVSVAAEAEDPLPIKDETTDATLTITCSEAIDKDTLIEGENLARIWDVARIKNGGFDSGIMVPIPEYDLISPEVIELSGKLKGPKEDEKAFAEGELIRVAYEPSEATDDDTIGFVRIKDLAGNELVESVHYCHLELEEDQTN